MEKRETTVKDGLPTAKKVLAKHYDVDNRVDEAAIVYAMQEYSDQQNAELRERVKELEESKAQDLSFLIEIRDRFKKSHLDVVQREYVEQMLSDWIVELEGKK